MKAVFRHGRVASAGLAMTAVLAAQSGAGSPGQFSGPNVLSRFSRMPGGTNRAPTQLRGYLFGSYGYLDGLNGPVNIVDGQAVRTSLADASHNVMLGGGLTLSHLGKRSSVTFSYLGNHNSSYGSSGGYNGLNQDVNFNYERQLSRRWSFYTGQTLGTQSNILGVSRGNSQSNLFDQAYSASTEALDARLRFYNSGGGVYFQKSSRLIVSVDGGAFAVSRKSNALVSSRGERAQTEIAYRTSRSQSIGAIYSFSHFYFPRGFGESFTHSAMLSYTKRIDQHWNLAVSGGPYVSQSERVRAVAVDPYITSLTGQTSTLTVFKGTSRGLGVNASISGIFRRQSIYGSYRRAVDPGNGLTLTSLSSFGNFNYSYQTTRKFSTGFSLFGGSLNPLLAGSDRNATFFSYGANLSANYRLISSMYATASVGSHRVSYGDLSFRQTRRIATIGLAFSPGNLPLRR